MNLTLTMVATAAVDVARASSFYTTAFTGTSTEAGERVELDLHGAGRFAIEPADEAGVVTEAVEPAAWGGVVFSYILDQPAEVRAIMDIALRQGAQQLKPAKKALFGSFSGALRAPDGTVWKLAANNGKDTAPAVVPPRPTETTVILGVDQPKASKAFYERLGLTTDRDYGNKYIDFHAAPGASRLSLMERDVLAKDAGVDDDGSRGSGLVLEHRTESRDEVSALLAAAAEAGGKVAAAADESDAGYSGCFTDLDGFLWRVLC